MAVLAVKIKIDTTDEIVLLLTLYKVQNFKPCNKYLELLTREVDFMTKKIIIDNFIL